jgi:hypothetical protein
LRILDKTLAVYFANTPKSFAVKRRGITFTFGQTCVRIILYVHLHIPWSNFYSRGLPWTMM